MAAVSGQRLENLTKETLTKIRTDQNFDHSHANVVRKSEGLLGEPTLPRKRPIPARLEVGAGAPSYPQTAKDHFRRVYYEAIDLIVRAIYRPQSKMWVIIICKRRVSTESNRKKRHSSVHFSISASSCRKWFRCCATS